MEEPHVQCSSSSRQSSTRWTPTSEQIKILKDLYYKSGIRSPTAEQIQNISARLRQFGKIEGKNVFYWFQNHKARERLKNKSTSSSTTSTQQHHFSMQTPSNIITYPSGNYCPSSAGQMVGGCGYGHMSMESNFRECGMSAYGGIYCLPIPTQSFQWTSGVSNSYNINQAESYTMNLMEEGTRKDSCEYEYDESPSCAELETLPLFPIHADQQLCGTIIMRRRSRRRRKSPDESPQALHNYSYTSLELSLNSTPMETTANITSRPFFGL